MTVALKLTILGFLLAISHAIDTLEFPLRPKNIHIYQGTNLTYPLDDFPNAFQVQLKKSELIVTINEPRCSVSPFKLYPKLTKTLPLQSEADSAVYSQNKLFILDKKDSKIDVFGFAASNLDVQNLGSIDFKSIGIEPNFHFLAYGDALLLVSKTKFVWYIPDFPKLSQITQKNVVDGHFNIDSLSCVYINQNHLFLCGEGKGLLIYDLPDLNSPGRHNPVFRSEITRGNFQSPSLVVKDIAITNDNLIYVLDKVQGVLVFQIASLDAPVLVDTITISGGFKVEQSSGILLVLSEENGNTYLSEYFREKDRGMITHELNRKIKLQAKTQKVWIRQDYAYLSSKGQTSSYSIRIPEDSVKGAKQEAFYKNIDLTGTMVAQAEQSVISVDGKTLKIHSLVAEKATLFCDASKSRNGTWSFDLSALQFNCKSQISGLNQNNVPSCLYNQKIMITVERARSKGFLPANIVPWVVAVCIGVIAAILCIRYRRRGYFIIGKSGEKKEFNPVQDEETIPQDDDNTDDTQMHQVEMRKF